MRTFVLSVLVASLLASMAAAELPKSVEELKTRIATEANTPQGATKLWFDCVFVYLSGDKELGTALITQMTKDKDWQATMSYFVSSINNQPYVWRSYAKGTSPENQYAMDPQNYELALGEPNMRPYADYEEGRVVLIKITSSGADLPRPFTLERNGRGEYKAREFSSLCTGARPPKTAVIAAGDIPESKDPLWVWKEFLHATLMYLAGQQEVGKQNMTALLKDEDFYLIDRYMALTAEKAYIWRSYCKNTKVDDGYKVDPDSFEIDAELKAPVTPETKRVTLWVKTTGGNMPRPLQMVADDRGQFRISEISSLCVGLANVPKDPKDDEF